MIADSCREAQPALNAEPGGRQCWYGEQIIVDKPNCGQNSRHSGGREVISAGREAWRANKPISNPTTFLTATDRHDHMIFGRTKLSKIGMIVIMLTRLFVSQGEGGNADSYNFNSI